MARAKPDAPARADPQGRPHSSTVPIASSGSWAKNPRFFSGMRSRMMRRPFSSILSRTPNRDWISFSPRWNGDLASDISSPRDMCVASVLGETGHDFARQEVEVGGLVLDAAAVDDPVRDALAGEVLEAPDHVGWRAP